MSNRANQNCSASGTQSGSACYAILPAAGRSSRMGQCKLMLPWPTAERPSGTVIDHVLSAWTSSCVECIVVVVRADDDVLATACENWPVTLLRPEVPPVDMKASVQQAVHFIDEHFAPSEASRCFVAPADLPTLTCRVIDRLARTSFHSDRIVVPSFGAKQGHPVLLPWTMMPKVFQLAENEGIDQLVDRHPKECVLFPAEAEVTDVDTPEEYRAALSVAKLIAAKNPQQHSKICNTIQEPCHDKN